jgi:hypothetical protein
MKLYDKDSPVPGPVDLSFIEQKYNNVVPSENYSLLELHTSPTFTHGEKTELGGKIVEDIESEQEELKYKLLNSLLEDKSDDQIVNSIKSSYSKEYIQKNATLIKRILAEKGLFGRVYLDSKFFKKCHLGDKVNIVHKHASQAHALISKRKCSGCVYNSNNHCAIYNKDLVNSISYDETLLKKYASYFKMGKDIDLYQVVSSGKTIKEALQYAFNLQPKKEPVRMAKGATSLSRANSFGAHSEKVLSSQQFNIFKKISNLIISEKTPDLSEFKGTLAHQILAEEESGLYGNLYVRSDLIGECKTASKYLYKNSNTAAYVVMGKPCEHYDCDSGKCSALNKIIVSEMDYSDSQVIKSALHIALQQGRIAKKHIKPILSNIRGKSSKEIKKIISNMFMLPVFVETQEEIPEDDFQYYDINNSEMNTIKFNDACESDIEDTMDKNSFFDSLQEDLKSVKGNKNLSAKEKLDAKEVYIYTTAKMNEGLYGDDLYNVLLFKFGKTKLKANTYVLSKLLPEQGLMGIYYINPSVYSSCHDGAKILRNKGTKYIKRIHACESCRSNTEGYCSVYNKQVVDEVPYIDKNAQQKSILNRNSSENLEFSDIISYQSMLEQFEVQNNNLEDISLNDELNDTPLEITHGGMILDFED